MTPLNALSSAEPRLAILKPPYHRFEPITTAWVPPALPLPGCVLVWWLVDGSTQEREFQWLYDRLPGLPLVVILPPAREITRAMPLVNYVAALNPRGVLPTGRLVNPARIRDLVAAPPQQMALAVTRYLEHRGLLRTTEIRSAVQRIFEVAPEVRSISSLARRLCSSRRTLGRHFAAQKLPVPSHWLQLARILYTVVRLQNDSSAIFRIAARSGYPDGFTFSNQMKRLTGCRPTQARECVGWEWILEAWIRQEARTGGFCVETYREALRMYLD